MTLIQGAFQASGSERNRQCQSARYHTVCIATPFAEPLNKHFTMFEFNFDEQEQFKKAYILTIGKL